MPKVDCWRLLGVAPEASAEEVRAGFAKRVRDVHPDSGGTGDALTMRLLVEARDEALGLAGRRASGGPRRAWGEGGAGGRPRAPVPRLPPGLRARRARLPAHGRGLLDAREQGAGPDVPGLRGRG